MENLYVLERVLQVMNVRFRGRGAKEGVVLLLSLKKRWIRKC